MLLWLDSFETFNPSSPGTRYPTTTGTFSVGDPWILGSSLRASSGNPTFTTPVLNDHSPSSPSRKLIVGFSMFLPSTVGNTALLLRAENGPAGQVQMTSRVVGSRVKFFLESVAVPRKFIAETPYYETDRWYYFEVELVIDETAGSFRWSSDGVQQVFVEGINTERAYPVESWDAVTIGLNSAGCMIDDLYVANGRENDNAPPNVLNRSAGPSVVALHRPVELVSFDGYSPFSGTVESIAEAIANDANFIQGPSIDSGAGFFWDGSYSSTGALLGIQFQVRARETSPTGLGRLAVQDGSRQATAAWAGLNLTSTFATYTLLAAGNPSTDRLWYPTDLSDSIVGIVF